MKAYKLIVTGKIQGVGFRRNVQQLARRLGISGEVKNLEDGDVEILAQGDDEKIGEFIGLLATVPLPAKVEGVKVKKPAKVSKRRRTFKIVHGNVLEELDEGLGAYQEQLALLNENFAHFQGKALLMKSN